jgi:hypothetical protein
MGPVLTTGVALVTAVVVVANPLASPVRDLQISTAQLSTSPQALIPFDKDLLNSIAQPSAASKFNAALAQILGALAAEADRIGREVNSDVSTTPSPDAAAQVTQFDTPAASDVPAIATPNGTPSASSTLSRASLAASTPGVRQIVSDLAAKTTYLGNKVVDAAYAAVDAIVNTPNLFIKAVQAFFKGDLSAALGAVIDAIKGFFDPGLILVGGIDSVFDPNALQLRPLNPAASPTAAGSVDPSMPQTAMGGTGKSATDPETNTVAEPGSNNHYDTKGTASTRRAATQTGQTREPLSAGAPPSAGQPETTSGSSAGAPGTASASRSAGLANSKVTDSVKAVPGTTAGSSDGNGSGGSSGGNGSGGSASEATDQGSSAPAPKASKGTGGTKRQHKSDSAAQAGPEATAQS